MRLDPTINKRVRVSFITTDMHNGDSGTNSKSV